MANIFKKFFTNCAFPEGRMGRAMLSMMNFGHAPLTRWGLSLIEIKDHWTMLDIGCGGGATLKRLLRRSADSKIYGIDLSAESVAKAQKVNRKYLNDRVFIEQGSALKLPYEENQFDLITAIETVYFWPHLPSCLNEVYRVLTPQKQFVIMLEVVNKNSMWTTLVEGMNGYTPEQLKELLEEAGFIKTTLHRKQPSYATITGTKP